MIDETVLNQLFPTSATIKAHLDQLDSRRELLLKLLDLAREREKLLARGTQTKEA